MHTFIVSEEKLINPHNEQGSTDGTSCNLPRLKKCKRPICFVPRSCHGCPHI